MVEFLFLDLDDTILDFHKAEHIALGKTFRQFGLEPEDHGLAQHGAWGGGPAGAGPLLRLGQGLPVGGRLRREGRGVMGRLCGRRNKQAES